MAANAGTGKGCFGEGLRCLVLPWRLVLPRSMLRRQIPCNVRPWCQPKFLVVYNQAIALSLLRPRSGAR